MTKTDYKYEDKDWGFGIYHFNSSPKLRVANKKNGKWSLSEKNSTIYKQIHNHVGSFKAVMACNSSYTDCVVVIWPLEKYNAEKIMTDSYENTLDHVVIKDTDFYYAKNINLKKSYTVYYNGVAMLFD